MVEACCHPLYRALPAVTRFQHSLARVRPKPPTARGAATGKGEDDAGERNGVQDAGLDVLGPHVCVDESAGEMP